MVCLRPLRLNTEHSDRKVTLIKATDRSIKVRPRYDDQFYSSFAFTGTSTALQSLDFVRGYCQLLICTAKDKPEFKEVFWSKQRLFLGNTFSEEVSLEANRSCLVTAARNIVRNLFSMIAFGNGYLCQ